MKNIVTVYHLDNDKFLNKNRTGFISDALQKIYLDVTVLGNAEAIRNAIAIVPDAYRKVARVQTTDLDEAFMLTNHIEHSWTENEKVGVYADRVRSTSVGDLIEDENNQWWIVASCGFTRIAF